MDKPNRAYGPPNPVYEFVDLMARRPTGPRLVFDLDDYYAELMLRPTGRRPANFDAVVRALVDPEARKLFGEQLMTLDGATKLLRCSGPKLVARVEAGELYGLQTPHGWLFSRRRVRELRDLDVIRKWLTPAALSAIEEPS